MIQRVFLFFILPMAIIAAFLALFGVHQIEFGETYYKFMGSVNQAYQSWSFEIPSIPKIDRLDLLNP